MIESQKYEWIGKSGRCKSHVRYHIIFVTKYRRKCLNEIRNEVFDALARENIMARKYFYPLTNTFECFHGKYDVDDTPVARHIANRVLTLPLYAELKFSEADRICNVIRKCCRD